MKTRLDANIPIEDFDEILREEKIQRKAGTATLVFQYVVSAFVIIAGAFLCLGVLLDRGELETELAGLPLLLTVVHAINSIPYVWWLVWLVLYAILAVFLPYLLSLLVFSFVRWMLHGFIRTKRLSDETLPVETRRHQRAERLLRLCRERGSDERPIPVCVMCVVFCEAFMAYILFMELKSDPSAIFGLVISAVVCGFVAFWLGNISIPTTVLVKRCVESRYSPQKCREYVNFFSEQREKVDEAYHAEQEERRRKEEEERLERERRRAAASSYSYSGSSSGSYAGNGGIAAYDLSNCSLEEARELYNRSQNDNSLSAAEKTRIQADYFNSYDIWW